MDELLLSLKESREKAQILQKVVSKLWAERQLLNKEIEKMQEELQSVQAKLQQLEMVQSTGETADNSAFKARIKNQIDTYIHEIDICLETLGETF